MRGMYLASVAHGLPWNGATSYWRCTVPHECPIKWADLTVPARLEARPTSGKAAGHMPAASFACRHAGLAQSAPDPYDWVVGSFLPTLSPVPGA
jgi:hypothetical protein